MMMIMISCYVLTGNARRSYCLQDAEFSRLSIFRSEFLLKPKLHEEHSSVADTFNFYFLDISESFDPWVLSGMSCSYFVIKIIWSFTVYATVHFLQVLTHLLHLIPWRRILPQNVYVRLIYGCSFRNQTYFFRKNNNWFANKHCVGFCPPVNIAEIKDILLAIIHPPWEQQTSGTI